jgi:SpoVK/Ycf46/Vps4 family AAA+-type ATPase
VSIDPSVTRALERALEDDPDNAALRLHLGGLLVMGGDPARALEHAQVVLAQRPDHQDALVVAREAAQALGDGARAEAYGRLLGLDPAPTAPPAPPQDEEGDRVRSVEREEDYADDPRRDDDHEGPVRPTVTLADVGGLEDVKARLDATFLAPLRNPELQRFYGTSLRGGLMLYGPPGCGKTFLARAVAGELGASFFSLGISDVLDMYVGESERRLHAAFATARRAAPCVLFLDELDALGQKRSQMRNNAGRNTVNQLLAELDGVDEDNDGLFILAATNHPWDVDTALRRPGRLDRTVLVLPPDEPARAAILGGALATRPADGVDVAQLARKTEGCSGADLVHLVETAAEAAIQESIRTGAMAPITQAQLDAARGEVRPSTRPWFSTAYNYALYANDGGEYDDLLAYIRRHKLL